MVGIGQDKADMKAAQINGYGGEHVVVVQDSAQPQPGKNQVLVRVFAAGVNPFDWKVREGLMRQMAELKFPATLGGDVAGVVEALGEGASGFAVGDEVYGQAGALSGKGSFAEFTLVNVKSLANKPQSLDFVAAAALPLAAVSAYQALVDHAKLSAGQKVLIHGAAGGIGTFAVQLAKHLGAHIAVTVAPDAADYVTSLGANECIDYTAQDFTELIQDYDVVFDLVGGDVTARSYQALKKGGILVSMLSQPDEALTAKYGVRMVGQFTQVTTARLQAVAGLVDGGALRLQAIKVFALDEAPRALEFVHQGKQHGKVVIRVR